MAIYRHTNYTFTPGTRQIQTGLANLTVNNIVKIVNSTTGMTIAAPMMMGTIASVQEGVITYNESTQINLPSGAVKTWSLPPLQSGNVLYIELDMGVPSYREVSDADIDAMVQRITAN